MPNKFQGQNKKSKLIESAITKIVRRVLKEETGQLEFVQTNDSPSPVDVVVTASEKYDKFVVKTGSGERLGVFSSDKQAFAAAKTYISQNRRGSVYFVGYTGNMWKSE